MSKDKANNLRALKEHLTEWLKRAKKIQDAAPVIQEILEVTDWEIDALDNSPIEADEIPFEGISVKLNNENDYIKSTFALPVNIEPYTLMNTSAITTSGSSVVYGYVGRIGDLGTPDAMLFSQKFTGLYQKLGESHSRRQKVAELITKLNNPQTIDRFEKAYRSFMASKSGVVDRTAAATNMRNLLDGVKGDLFSLARKIPLENMTWEIMVDRLSKGNKNAPEYIELLNQEAERSKLISRLSDVLKDREGGSITNLENVWIQILDHLYTLLGLVDFEGD